MLLLFIVVCCGNVMATTYYVNSTGGLDSNDGLTTGTPWQTISKVNSMGSALGNQTILFARGEIVEIIHSESEKSQLMKENKYPLPVTFVKVEDALKPLYYQLKKVLSK